MLWTDEAEIDFLWGSMIKGSAVQSADSFRFVLHYKLDTSSFLL